MNYLGMYILTKLDSWHSFTGSYGIIMLISAIERCEKLEKQLEIAVKALEEYTSNESYRLCLCYIHRGKKMFASTVAAEALAKIKGLDK